ncbi:MAG: hypothetical protein RSD00_00320, partial [Bacilli bacterium]
MKKKNIILVLISSIFIILVIYININYKLTKKEDISKKEDNIKPLVTNIAMLSKPLGTTTFTEITSTPTTGSWTIETDCRGMTVTWDDKTHRLKTSIT